MVMQFSGIPGTNVTISGGAGVPIPNSEQTLYNDAGTGNGAVQTVRTVTAGKTYYLLGVSVQGASNSLTVWKTDGTTRVIGGSVAAAGEGHSFWVLPSSFATWAAGEFVKVTATNGAVYNLIGIEV